MILKLVKYNLEICGKWFFPASTIALSTSGDTSAITGTPSYLLTPRIISPVHGPVQTNQDTSLVSFVWFPYPFHFVTLKTDRSQTEHTMSSGGCYRTINLDTSVTSSVLDTSLVRLLSQFWFHLMVHPLTSLFQTDQTMSGGYFANETVNLDTSLSGEFPSLTQNDHARSRGNQTWETFICSLGYHAVFG